LRLSGVVRARERLIVRGMTSDMTCAAPALDFDGTIAKDDVLDPDVLVAGDAMSGKPWVTGLLCEQLILCGYCLCILDPEGDYTSL
jgi:hypothetical protein